jgi:hypothetical protein
MTFLPLQLRLPLLVAASLVATALAAAGHEHSLPSYHYGAPIRVECMNRSS